MAVASEHPGALNVVNGVDTVDMVVEVDMVVGHMAVKEVSRAFCCLHVAVFNWDGCGGTEQQRSPETRSEICQD